MSCHVMSCDVMSCHVMSCHVMRTSTEFLRTFSPMCWSYVSGTAASTNSTTMLHVGRQSAPMVALTPGDGSGPPAKPAKQRPVERGGGAKINFLLAQTPDAAVEGSTQEIDSARLERRRHGRSCVLHFFRNLTLDARPVKKKASPLKVGDTEQR